MPFLGVVCGLGAFLNGEYQGSACHSSVEVLALLTAKKAATLRNLETQD